MKAVIIAGGKGTRMGYLTKEVPKPMLKVCQKPILLYQMQVLKKSGITDIIIIIGYLGDKIKNFFGDGTKYGLNIEYVVEEEPLGTAGAFYFLKDIIKEDFIFLYGDIFLDINFKKMIEFHKQKKSTVTVFAHPNSHPKDSDLLIINKQDKVLALDFKTNARENYYRNLVAAGIYILSPNVFNNIKEKKQLSFEKEVLFPLVCKNDSIYAYRSSEYAKDMGTIDRYKQVKKDFKNGLVYKRNIFNKQKCIFIDRDGTINKNEGFISDENQIKLIPKVAEAIHKINNSEYLCIVITNQPVIARGECTFEKLQIIHNKIETLLGECGAYLDDIYFCPHHKDKGFNGEIKHLKFDCNCRKPKIGMLIEAAKKYNINLKKSYFIGDTTVDIMTAKNAKVKSILVMTGEKGKDMKYDVKPYFVADNLGKAVKFILEGGKK